MTNICIPSRFRDEVMLHAIQNLRPTPTGGTGLILGIHGPPGEGKTFQVERILSEARFETFLVSGGQLESGTAGFPAEIVRSTYIDAGVHITNGRPAAVLLNDADAAIGSWGQLTQYTVNTQNVITELMHLADYPTRVEGRETPRVPVFITGNDFGRLYSPLRRAGRMRLFRWVLSVDERAAIVSRIFPGIPTDDIERLLHDFPGRPVSFWAAVNAQMERARLLAILKRSSFSSLAVHLVKRGDISVDVNTRPDLDTIRSACAEFLENEKFSHL